jgi:hypothetical protein
VLCALRTCEPSYYGKVYDRAQRRHVATKRFVAVAAARGARKTLLDALEKGELPREAPQRLRDARAQFIAAAEEGRALNKHGRRDKQSAWEDIDECLRKHVTPKLGARRLTDIRRSPARSDRATASIEYRWSRPGGANRRRRIRSRALNQAGVRHQFRTQTPALARAGV